MVQTVFPDIVFHRRVQEFRSAPEGQQPPKLGGGNLTGHRFRRGDRGAHFFQSVDPRQQEIFFLFSAPGHYGNGGGFHNFLCLLPFGETQEPVGAHHKGQLRAGVPFPQGPQGLPGVAAALCPDLQVGNLQNGVGSRRQPDHFQPLLRCGRALRHLLSRNLPGRNEYHLIQAQSLRPPDCRPDMAGMGRVKGPAENADPFHNRPPFPICPENQFSFFSCLRAMAWSMACWRK